MTGLPSGTHVHMKGQQDDAVSLASVLGKVREQITPRAIPWHVQGTQQGFRQALHS